MAQLSVKEILKPFNKGEMMGKERYHMLIKKIENKEPFVFSGTGELNPIKFESDSDLRVLKSNDVEKINNLFAGSSKPFVLDMEGETSTFGIRRLEKTEEFGGGTGGGKKIDPHELMTAALILKYGSQGKRLVPTGDYSNLNKAKKAIKELQSTARSIIYTSANKQETIAAFAGDYQNYGKAISAADGFLRDLGTNSKVSRVHATGKQWLKILSKYFAVNKHEYFGDKDYNSSDLIVEVSRQDRSRGKKLFVGVSLKKKGIGKKESSPTIINKTVIGENGLLSFLLGDEARTGNFQTALADLYRSRAQFFFDVIKAGLEAEDPKTREFTMRKLSISDGEKDVKVVSPSTTMKTGSPAFKRAQEERVKKVEKKKLENITAYLNKLERLVSTNRAISSKVLEQAQKLDQANMTAALRGAWPPKKPVYNQYFFDLDSVIRNPKVAKPLSIALLNIMFKVDLKRLIQDRGRYSEEFIFTLITGSGDLVDKGIVSKTAEVIPEANSTTVLMELISNPLTIYKLEKPKNYRQAFERNPDGAKLKYNLFANAENIALLEIRYKGSITAEPQFQAYITPTFSKLLTAPTMPKTTY